MITFKEWLLLEAKLSSEQIQEIESLLNGENSIADIERITGISFNSVNRVLSRLNLSDEILSKIKEKGQLFRKLPKKKLTDIQRKEIEELLKSCSYSIKDIANAYGISKTNVLKFAKKIGISQDCLNKMEKIGRGVIQPEVINKMIELWKTCEYTLEDIATLLDVSSTSVYRVINNIKLDPDCIEKINDLRRTRNIEAGQLGGAAIWDKRGDFWEWLKTLPEDKQKATLHSMAFKKYPNNNNDATGYYIILLNKAGLTD